MLFTVPSTGGFERKPYSSLVLKSLQKISETRKLEFIHEYHFVERENEVRKPDKNSSFRRLEFMTQKPRLKIPFKNSISGQVRGQEKGQ
jgi:hypothetical protein